MVSIEIQGNTRSELGKKGTRIDRNNGNVPAVLYGGGDVVHFTDPPESVP